MEADKIRVFAVSRTQLASIIVTSSRTEAANPDLRRSINYGSSNIFANVNLQLLLMLLGSSALTELRFPLDFHRRFKLELLFARLRNFSSIVARRFLILPVATSFTWNNSAGTSQIQGERENFHQVVQGNLRDSPSFVYLCKVNIKCWSSCEKYLFFHLPCL